MSASHTDPSRDNFLFTEANELLTVHGRNELEEKVTPSWLVFLRQVTLFPVERGMRPTATLFPLQLKTAL